MANYTISHVVFMV